MSVARTTGATRVDSGRGRSTKGMEAMKMTKNVTLWVVQGLLAALFLLSGIMKLVMPPEAMAGPVALPVVFLRFIGVCEALGAIGLILPGLLRIHMELTPAAAAGLAIIMIGAVVVTIMGGAIATALVPLVTGLLAGLVIYGRWRPSPA